MFNRQLSKNIKELDKKIGVINEELDTIDLIEDEEIERLTKQLDKYVDLRCKLAGSKNINGSVKGAVVTGVFGIASVVIVLKYEETDVITSKAFNMATSMFRGSK